MPDIKKENIKKETESIETPICIFRSAYNLGNKDYSQDISREVEDIYELDENGRPVKTGETNIYEKIQASKDECEIYNILKRYESGDFSAIKDPNNGAVYGDFTNVQTDMLSSMDNMSKALENWEKLPKGLRSLYHDNITEFMNATPEDINVKVNSYIDSITPKSKEGDDK